MICFYHSADFDGICSGAIVKLKYPDCYLYGINHGQDFPWDMLKEDDTVIICDYSLQPFDDMVKLEEMTEEFIWIDHHSAAMKDYEESQERYEDLEITGLREVGRAGCELTWEYFYPDKDVPAAVHYLGRYDVWDHSEPETLPFQYGMRSLGREETRPYDTYFWGKLFEQDVSDDWLISIVTRGVAIISYIDSDNERYVNSYSFVTEFEGLRTLIVNRGMASSKLFGSIYDPEVYDIMMAFCKLPQHPTMWTVSMYTTREDVDCGSIARLHGGGGHKEAAGFQCDTRFLLEEILYDSRPRDRESGE